MAPDVDAPTLAGAESEKLKSREWVGMIKAGEFFQASEVRTKEGQRLAERSHQHTISIESKIMQHKKR